MNDEALIVNKVHLAGFTVRIVLEKVVAGGVEKALKGVQLDLQQGPLVHVASPVDAHMALRSGQVGGLVVIQSVRFNDHVGSA